jgi:hypothetical protein
MDKKEFALFAMALKTYYPRENLLPNNQAMELWFEQLQDIPAKVAEAGLKKWVAINKWSPSISDIREMASSITVGELPDWGEAWEEVCNAIRHYGSYRTKEALESMSPLARKATERIGFLNLCMSESPMTDRANFRMIYESLAEREKKDAQLPPPLKQLILEMQGNGNLIESKEEK